MVKYPRKIKRLPLCICLAALLWLADSLLLSHSGGFSFADALWQAAPPGRQLLRLALLMALLLLGFISSLMANWRLEAYKRLPPARRCQLYGSPESPVIGDRLHYHAFRLALLLGLGSRERENLRLLCYCHDLGLIGVPGHLQDQTLGFGLNLAPPPGAFSFSQAEQKLYDRHVDLGAEIAAAIPKLNRAARLICCHEEHYDGGGPKSLYGKSIPLACRIFAVARMYDFFVNPHRGGRVLELPQALDELDLYAGTLLDPDVVAAFRQLMTDRRLAAVAVQEIYASQ